MDSLIAFLGEYGYLGMLVSSFIAGSFFPMSSEVIMLGFIAAGLDPWALLFYATVGNVLGSMFNYFVGTLGRIDWIERYLHVKKESLDKAQRFMAGRGAWMGFFAFLPVLGSALTIVLGLMRANLIITILSISLGKFLRYLLIVYGVEMFV